MAEEIVLPILNYIFFQEPNISCHTYFGISNNTVVDGINPCDSRNINLLIEVRRSRRPDILDLRTVGDEMYKTLNAVKGLI